MIPVRDTAPDIERAQHEAGHCVVAHMLNVPNFAVRYVTIHSDASGYAGGTFNLDFDDATAEQWGVMLMAGVAAQMHGIVIRNKYDEDDPRVASKWARVWEQGQQDRRVFCEKVGSSQYYQEYLKRAQVVVREGWELVESISSELLKVEHRTLYLDEFAMLAIAHEHRSNPSMLLEPYRRHRQKRDYSGRKWFDNFRASFPDLPWFEPVNEFLRREFKSDQEEPRAWYERLMGFPYEGD